MLSMASGIVLQDDVFIYHISSAKSSNVPPDILRGEFDVEVYYSNGDTRREVEGPVEFSPEATRGN